jgi:hypothetical protein
MSETTATNEGCKLINEWQEAVERERQLSRDHTDALNRERAARLALGKWMIPADAKAGEKFGIWERDRNGNEVMFELEHRTAGDSEIRIRRRK